MSRSPELDQFRKGEGSLKLKAARPRSRTGSGGILRLDITKTTPTGPRDPNQCEPSSPQPSIDRLSVTFATDDRNNTESPVNVYGTPPISCMEKVRFPTITDGEDSPEEDDYSASVTAIMQRRASTRKSRRKSRRTSSPFSHENDGAQVRRRSSCVTTSSGDTAISIEESLQPEVTQEQIFENIRLHKEVLGSVKLQPWDMRRKIKLVQQAKSYIKRHEGVLQERLAQSRSTRDILARWNIFLVQQWQHYKRELANLSNILIPWESRIKEIESHFGSVVASYFTFLRWLFWVNMVISVILVAFVAVPELLTADPASDGERKVILLEEQAKATNLFTLWDFEGVLKYSPLFYGYYTDKDHSKNGYRLPFAYFMTGLAVYIYSFVATLRKMAENSRMSKLSEKDDECVFSWKLFTGWDYMIGNAETAQNRVASIILGFKEALLEEAEKKREPRNWKIISARIFVNLVVALLLVASAYAVVQVVNRSIDKPIKQSWWRRNEITVVMSLISLIFPIFFEVLGLLEHYHPRKQLRLQLARIMVLNLLNLYSMIFALFAKIRVMTDELKKLQINKTIVENCTNMYVDCSDIYEDCTSKSYPNPRSASLTSAIWANLSLALILTQLNPTNITTNLSSTAFKPQLNLTNIVNHVQRAEEYEEYFDFSEYDNETDYEYFKTTEASKTTTEEYYYDFPEYDNETYYDLDDVTTEPDNGVLENYFKNDTKGRMKDVFEETVEGAIGKIVEVVVGNTNENMDELQISLIRNATEELVRSLVINGTTLMEYLVGKLILLRSSEVSDETLIDLVANWTNGFIGKSTDDIMDTLARNLTMDSNETWTRNITSDLMQFLMKHLTNNVTDNIGNSSDTWTEYYEDFTDVSKIELDNITNVTDLPETWNVSTTIDPILFNFTTQTTTLDYSNQTGVDSNTTQQPNNSKDFLDIANMPQQKCLIRLCENTTKIESPRNLGDYEFRKKLRNLCWETMFGQELVKLTIMDLSFTIISTLAVDFIRALFVRIMNNFWCWDLEKQFPQYGDFKIAENILHLVNNQGMVWMGMFFSPGLTVINLIKLAIMMYLRSWAVLTCNVPHEVVFRASRSNNFYLALLLTMLFLCVLPVGYAMVWIKPSWHCGPFSGHERIYHIFTKSLKGALPESLHEFLDYIASPFIVIPLLVLLVLIIYYMISLTNALREANNDLKMQLRRERTEERRKMFQMADRKRRGASGDSADYESTPFGKWKKLLPILPSSKSFDADTPNKDNADKKDKLASFIRKAIKKPSGIPKPPPPDDATDTEQHDSLPEDINNSQEHENKILLNLKKMIQAKQNAKLSSKLSNQGTSTPDKSQEKSPKRRQVQRKGERIKSSSKSSSSKDMRQDSLTSNWSDNIPVIKISEIESTDCILEYQTDSLQRKLKHQRNIDESHSELQMAEPQCPSSSTETLVTVKLDEGKARGDAGGKRSKFDIRVKGKSSIDTELSVDLIKSINSDTTKTEDSSYYKE